MLNALSLTQEQDKPLMKSGITDKQWNWSKMEQLSASSRKLLDQLTERERDVLKLMSSGLPNKDIAAKLFVSPGTVKTHTLNIYIKMDVNNRTSAILKAIELKWLV
jgi:DNA-binding NarL/FixJ family response regulator